MVWINALVQIILKRCSVFAGRVTSVYMCIHVLLGSQRSKGPSSGTVGSQESAYYIVSMLSARWCSRNHAVSGDRREKSFRVLRQFHYNGY